ncbi:SGNH/GDSL hydrolase family protein [Leifsonia sp. L25]|uniref:SGNH/GDSL hydrolase family protein n=1 Tax=Leifsonia TaxID=110932 RepID=UPI003D6788F6
MQNYPHTAAARAGLELTDVSCTDATIADLFAPKKDVPAQTDALSASTSVVSLTIGGNDLGFASVLQSCLAASAQGPLLSGEASCRAKYTVGGVDTLSKKVTDRVAPALRDAVTRIRAKAPNARVVVVGYPALMPDAVHTPAGGCFASLKLFGTSFPYATADLAYMNSVQSTLDVQSKAAAEAAGADYVSLMGNTFDHSSCSASPYLNPVELSGLSASPANLHPNATGLAYAGQAVGNVLAAPRGFQGVTGIVVPLGGSEFELQITVPNATLFTTPEVTAQLNGYYLSHVSGEFGWYLGVRQVGDGRVYHQSLTLKPGDSVQLRTASGAIQKLTR